MVRLHWPVMAAVTGSPLSQSPCLLMISCLIMSIPTILSQTSQVLSVLTAKRTHLSVLKE